MPLRAVPRPSFLDVGSIFLFARSGNRNLLQFPGNLALAEVSTWKPLSNADHMKHAAACIQHTYSERCAEGTQLL